MVGVGNLEPRLIAVGSAVGGFLAKGYDYAAPFPVGGIIMTAKIAAGARSVIRHAASAGV